jgi:branched-chain amino acid transport system permease protein
MQYLLNGSISGLTLAVLALAFQVVYLPCRVFFLALAGIYSLVPYIAVTCFKYGCPVWLSVLAAVAAGIIASVLCELLNHAPLERKQGSPGAHMITSLGIYLILVQAVAIGWGNETQVLRSDVSPVYHFGTDIVLTGAQALAGGSSILLLLAFYLWLRFSNLGLQFRAMADNPIQLALHGYNIRFLRLLAFAMAGLLASVNSLTAANDIGFDPHGGLNVLLLGIIAVIIGGNKSFLAPAIGGLLLGIIRSSAVWFLSARWQDAAAFLLLALFLLFLPQGILGRKRRLEAEE